MGSIGPTKPPGSAPGRAALGMWDVGWRRADGRVGVRNVPLVLSTVDSMNPWARRIASQVSGAVVVAPSHGRGLLGVDAVRFRRALVGLGSHPNVAATVVLSLDAETANAVAGEISGRGVPALALAFQASNGALPLVAEGAAWLTRQRSAALAAPTVTVSAGDLVVAVECGSSDASSSAAANPVVGAVIDRLVALGAHAVMSEAAELIGAEAFVADRAVSPDVSSAVVALAQRYVDLAARAGVDLIGINPAHENLVGGISTIEEKALGSVLKGGRTAPVVAVVDYAEPIGLAGPGVYLMDGPDPATENMTGMVAGGAQVVLFTTGAVNPVVSPLAPTLKITANPQNARRLADHIDVDVSDVWLGRTSIEAAAAIVTDRLWQVVQGETTAGERLGAGEIAISRFGPSV